MTDTENNATHARHGVRRAFLIAFTTVVIACVAVVGVTMYVNSHRDNPFAGRTLYVNPDSTAAVAAASATASGGASAAVFTRIASEPTAIWLLPEVHGIGAVGTYVSSVISAADTANAMPVFTIYGIPDRDCSTKESSGGLSTTDYPTWVAEIAAALKGHTTAVILEPDAIASSIDCGDTAERVTELKADIAALKDTGAAIYLDAGHSTWEPVATMAPIMNEIGMSDIRGFATNVSNFNSTDSETTYANALSAKTGDAHYIIDTSRNGNGGTSDWCNPTGRALGHVPTVIDNGTAQDADLWVKQPGESDGSCNGGPTAGTWWDAGALALATNAGWN